MPRKHCAYYDDEFEVHEAKIIERNGNLIYVEDMDTGKGEYICPHQIDREWQE